MFLHIYLCFVSDYLCFYFCFYVFDLCFGRRGWVLSVQLNAFYVSPSSHHIDQKTGDESAVRVIPDRRSRYSPGPEVRTR